nr:translation initiation factor IF-2 [bacterium]
IEKAFQLTPISPEQAFSTAGFARRRDKTPEMRPPMSKSGGKNLGKLTSGGRNARQAGAVPGRPGQNTRGGKNQGKSQPQGRPGAMHQQRPGMGAPSSSKPKHRPHSAPQAPVSKNIDIPEVIALSELASRLNMSASELIKYLISQGRMITINQALSYDEACEIANAFGFEVGEMADENIPLELIEDEDEGHLKPRPPVVTVLGHVDHGKTSLLDAIRKTSVTDKEAGGITQKIGAYTVRHNDHMITFIDTPGHEAFTHMRARGASITDLAILVVAANDGVMPQTIEAINHAKAANVPIMVAINKIDLPEANPDRVMQQLTEYGLVSEAWGGDTIMCEVSAKKHIGLEDLLEMILLVADMRELKANPDKRAQGTIIEGWLDKGVGPAATVLVQNGTLHTGDTVVVGKTWGRVRSLMDENGSRIRSAGPSIPAEIIGLSDVPNAGDQLQAVEDEKMAKQVSEARTAKERHARITSGTKQTLESLFNDLQNGVAKELKLLVKAEGHGSMEALNQSLNKLSTDEVAIKIIHSGVGAISESDIMLATASQATIIGFNVRPDSTVKRLADQEKVDIRTYRVIYHVIEDIRKAMSGLLSPDIEEVEVGRVEVRQIFKISKAGKVAGCYVTEGKVTRNSLVRLVRDNKIIYEGSIDTLKRFKDDAHEVLEGYECGLTLTNYQDIQEGDIIDVYQKVEHEREI